MKVTAICLSALLFAASAVIAETDTVPPPPDQKRCERRHSIGSSIFLLGNLDTKEPPAFALLNYSYRPGLNDIVFTEFITWTYYEPLGNYGSSDKRYPGKIKAFGLGFGYQHFWWKHLYSTVQATPFLQQFMDAGGRRMQNGFQLYLQSRLGYRIQFLKDRWFVEPSAAFNYWPVNTSFPEPFLRIEDGSPNYFLFEPGLNFGYRF